MQRQLDICLALAERLKKYRSTASSVRRPSEARPVRWCCRQCARRFVRWAVNEPEQAIELFILSKADRVELAAVRGVHRCVLRAGALGQRALGQPVAATTQAPSGSPSGGTEEPLAVRGAC